MSETDRIAALTAGVRELAETLREEYRKAIQAYEDADLLTIKETNAWGQVEGLTTALLCLAAVFGPLGIETGRSEEEVSING